MATLAVFAALVASGCAGNDDGRPVVTAIQLDDEEADERLPSAEVAGATEVAPGEPAAPITIAFAGDTQFIAGLFEDDPLGGMRALMQAPDVMVVNLETTIAETDVGTPPVDKEFLFRSPPGAAALLADAGVDVAALGNNHIWDFGTEATIRTLELLDEAAIARTGAGVDPGEAYLPAFVDVRGTRVGLISLSRVPCDWSISAPLTRPNVAWGCDAFEFEANAAIDTAIAGSDIAIGLLHVGTEGSTCAEPALRELARAWVGRGLDALVISHPHVLRGVEQIDGAWVLYSTGNYLFRNGGGETARSALFTLSFFEDHPDVGDDTILHARPVMLPGGRPRPAEGETATAIIDGLSDRSYGVTFNGFGVAEVDGSVGACG